MKKTFSLQNIAGRRAFRIIDRLRRSRCDGNKQRNKIIQAFGDNLALLAPDDRKLLCAYAAEAVIGSNLYDFPDRDRFAEKFDALPDSLPKSSWDKAWEIIEGLKTEHYHGKNRVKIVKEFGDCLRTLSQRDQQNLCSSAARAIINGDLYWSGDDEQFADMIGDKLFRQLNPKERVTRNAGAGKRPTDGIRLS